MARRVLAIVAWAAGLLGTASAAAWEWPQFHGPRRDNKSEETGLLEQWPEGGPKLLWTAKGIGHGFSTVAIADGRVYTTGNIAKQTVITALGLDGKKLWAVANGPAWRREVPGARGTPTIDGGRLYHENADGDVVCLDAKTGKEVWGLNILKKFRGRNIRWALAESLLVDGDRVICTPGGEAAGLVALDKASGETVWVCTGTHDKPGYCSPIIVDCQGLRQIVTLMAKSVVGVHAATGKLLWRVPHETRYDENISTPVFHNGCIAVSTQYTGARLLRLRVDGQRATAEEVWAAKAPDNQHGGLLLVDGCLYGSCRQEARGPWVCLDFATGERLWKARGIGRASATCADGRLYLLNHGRTVALVEPSAKAFRLVSQFHIPSGGRGPSWAHPVVCGGCLYIRHGDFLYCYDVKEK